MKRQGSRPLTWRGLLLREDRAEEIPGADQGDQGQHADDDGETVIARGDEYVEEGDVDDDGSEDNKGEVHVASGQEEHRGDEFEDFDYGEKLGGKDRGHEIGAVTAVGLSGNREELEILSKVVFLSFCRRHFDGIKRVG
jgi:hypothetical protein